MVYKMKSKKSMNRRKQRSTKMKKRMTGGISLETAQFPNVYNTIGFNTNLGNSNVDPSDSSNQISSRLLMGGSRRRRNLKKRTLNMRKKIKGGSLLTSDPFLGPAYNMNSATAFGTTPGALWSQNTVAGTPQDGPYTKFNISERPLV